MLISPYLGRRCWKVVFERDVLHAVVLSLLGRLGLARADGGGGYDSVGNACLEAHQHDINNKTLFTNRVQVSTTKRYSPTESKCQEQE